MLLVTVSLQIRGNKLKQVFCKKKKNRINFWPAPQKIQFDTTFKNSCHHLYVQVSTKAWREIWNVIKFLINVVRCSILLIVSSLELNKIITHTVNSAIIVGHFKSYITLTPLVPRSEAQTLFGLYCWEEFTHLNCFKIQLKTG